MVGLDIDVNVRKPSALRKQFTQMKFELLFAGNEVVIELTASELQGLQRFNRFVVWCISYRGSQVKILRMRLSMTCC